MNRKKNNVAALAGACTGCAACLASCPANAIKVKLNQEGFFTALVDEDGCINCGKCVQVCLRAGAVGVTSLMSGTMIAAQSKQQETVLSCTSGGIAYEFSCYAIENGWIVAGVVYDYQSDTAKTVLVDTKEKLNDLKGSKYIQSDFSDAATDLLRIAGECPEQHFLVIGTPCQIYGLASLLEQRKLRDQFVLVDLFCHGVPSYLVWNSYLHTLRKQLGNGALTTVAFRDKVVGWHNFVMHISSANGDYIQASEGDSFFRAFFDNVLFSEACFNCTVRKDCSKADIRLGDYWGKRYQNREDGVSAVLLLTAVGAHFSQNVTSIHILETTSVKEVLREQSTHSYTTQSLYAGAIQALQKSGALDATIRKYRRNFPVKQRLKLVLKEFTAHLPDDIRSGIRKIYKKI